MRSFRHLLALTFLLVPLLFASTQPATAAWEGTHRYSIALQGSVSALDRLGAQSQAVPVEFRATLLVNVDSPSAGGEYLGRVRVIDAQVHQADGMVSVPLPSTGYRIRLHPEEGHRLLDPADDLLYYGIDLGQILAMLFPVAPGHTLTEGTSWTVSSSQVIKVNETSLTLPTTNTFTVNEVRDALIVIQSSMRGSTSAPLAPGTVSADQLGSGVWHIDPETGNLLRSAVTVRSTIEKRVPAGALAPEERSLVRSLVTTSVERLTDVTESPIPSMGPLYVDPANRFSLRLPAGWSPEPVLIDHSLTLFATADQSELLFVDIAAATSEQEPTAVAQEQLDYYSRALVGFRVLTKPTPAKLGNLPAALAEYTYIDGVNLIEAGLFTQAEGYNIALQYTGAQSEYGGKGVELVETLGKHFTLGPNLQGQVSVDQLVKAASVLYESREYGFEIEVPTLWPPLEAADGSVNFVEIGGAGRLNIHLESVSPNESPHTLLEEWLARLQGADVGMELISPVEQAALGPLSGASAVLRWTEENLSVIQKIVVANWDGVLYVVSIEYLADGFEARAAVFDRIFSGFRPRLDWGAAQENTFSAYTPPPVPDADHPFLMIGRVLHEYAADGQRALHPADGVRIDLEAHGQTFTAIADEDGFFYLANLPLRDGDLVKIASIRGSLFGLPYDVSIPIEGLSLTVASAVSLVGELILVLHPDGESVSIRPESGFDAELNESRVHRAFLNRFPDSPWADLVRADLAERIGE